MTMSRLFLENVRAFNLIIKQSGGMPLLLVANGNGYPCLFCRSDEAQQFRCSAIGIVYFFRQFPHSLLEGDEPASQHTVAIVEHGGLPGGDGRCLFQKLYQQV